MSPLLASLCHRVRVQDHFVGHSTVLADFDIELGKTSYQTWPRPSHINWDLVDVPGWHATSYNPLYKGQNTTEFFKAFGCNWESSLQGFIPDNPSLGLESTQRGRGQRLTPSSHSINVPLCRAHRPGEVALNFGFPGQAVRMWYKQLRRLQSYSQAAAAGKQSPEAAMYRIEVWTSICRASGFSPSFPSWWNKHPLASQLGLFPRQPPSAVRASVIFQAFEIIFREFEDWHFKQRHTILEAKHAKSIQELFGDLRVPGKDQIDSLTRQHTFTPLAFDVSEGVLHLDGTPEQTLDCSWTLDDLPLHVSQIDGDIVYASLPAWTHIDSLVVQKVVLHRPSDVLAELEQFWKKR